MFLYIRNSEFVKAYSFTPNIEKVYEYRKNKLIEVVKRKTFFEASCNTYYGNFSDICFHIIKEYVPEETEFSHVINELLNGQAHLWCTKNEHNGEKNRCLYVSNDEYIKTFNLSLNTTKCIVEVPKELMLLDNLIETRQISDLSVDFVLDEHLSLFKFELVPNFSNSLIELYKGCEYGLIEDMQTVFTKMIKSESLLKRMQCLTKC